MAGLSKDQWTPHMKEVYRVLKPGIGWIQAVEFQGARFLSENGTLPENGPLREAHDILY